ncbi:MAG: DUF2953 domain-containing protein [Syntrophomonadaceae bacterium]|jgi:hypothetical protein
MGWIQGIGLALILLGAAVFLFRAYLSFDFKAVLTCAAGNNHIQAEFYILWAGKKKRLGIKNISLPSLSSYSPANFDVRTLLNHLKRFRGFNLKIEVTYEHLLSFLEKTLIETLEWKTVLGCDDAMDTAIASGGWWTLKGIILSLLTSKSTVKDFRIDVKPDYRPGPSLNSELHCIFRIRIVHIILVGRFLLFLIVRRYVSGSAARKTKCPAYRKPYENCHAEH